MPLSGRGRAGDVQRGRRPAAVPATDSDSDRESFALLADVDLAGAIDLKVYRDNKRRDRGGH